MAQVGAGAVGPGGGRARVGLRGPVAGARAVTPLYPQAAAPAGAARPASLLAACVARLPSSGPAPRVGSREEPFAEQRRRVHRHPVARAGEGLPYPAGVAVRRFFPLAPGWSVSSLRAGVLFV